MTSEVGSVRYAYIRCGVAEWCASAYLLTASEDLHCGSELSVDVSYYCLTGGHTHPSTDHTHCLQFTVGEEYRQNEMWSIIIHTFLPSSMSIYIRISYLKS